MAISATKGLTQSAPFRTDNKVCDNAQQTSMPASPSSAPTDSYSSGPSLWDPLNHPWGEETVRLTDNFLPTKRLRKSKLTSSRDRCEHLDTSSAGEDADE